MNVCGGFLVYFGEVDVGVCEYECVCDFVVGLIVEMWYCVNYFDLLMLFGCYWEVVDVVEEGLCCV